MPYEQVLAMWRNCMAKAYEPEALFARYEYQMRATRPNRLRRPWSRQRLSPRNIHMALTMLSKLIWRVGVRGSYRRAFWSFALPRLLSFRIERVLSVGLVAHHLIMFARDACAGKSNASNYSAKNRGAEMPSTLQSPAE